MSVLRLGYASNIFFKFVTVSPQRHSCCFTRLYKWKSDDSSCADSENRELERNVQILPILSPEVGWRHALSIVGFRKLQKLLDSASPVRKEWVERVSYEDLMIRQPFCLKHTGPLRFSGYWANLELNLRQSIGQCFDRVKNKCHGSTIKNNHGWLGQLHFHHGSSEGAIQLMHY